MPTILTPILLTVGLCILAAVSLLAKQEAVRGIGRVADGIAWISISFMWLAFDRTIHFLPSNWGFLPYLLAAAGLVFILSGLRKFDRSFESSK